VTPHLTHGPPYQLVDGPVLGQPMAADDLAFDRNGALYVSDMSGSLLNPIGRVIRFDPDGSHPTLVASGLSGANGILFDPDVTSLWVSEYYARREDHLALSPDYTSVTGSSVGMYASVGTGGLDSNAVDASGNVYQCVFGGGRVAIWDSIGRRLATVVIPQTFAQPELLVSNIAIKPGTKDADLTVGGTNGGFISRFTALGTGTRAVQRRLTNDDCDRGLGRGSFSRASQPTIGARADGVSRSSAVRGPLMPPGAPPVDRRCQP
jgi:lactonase